MKYFIEYTKAADRFLDKREDVRGGFEKAIEELLVGTHPETVDVKRIQGKRGDYYRIRLGDCRVVYTIIDGKVIVVKVVLAGSRGDIYKKMKGLK